MTPTQIYHIRMPVQYSRAHLKVSYCLGLGRPSNFLRFSGRSPEAYFCHSSLRIEPYIS
jgi:hypothetical protein